MPDVILGIHSNVRNGTIDPETGKAVDPSLSAGHAWLTVTRDGVTTTYGLWPDNHPDTVDNGSRTDIRVGMEAGDRAAASRYFQLTPEQATALESKLKENVEWGMTSNCSSWASETLTDVTGVRINANEPYTAGIVETPRVLGQSIHTLEQRDRTSRADPATPPTPSRSSSSLSDAGGATAAPAPEEHAALSPSAQALVADSEREVRQIAERHNLPWDQGMNNTVYAVAHQARADGLTEINRFNVQGDQIRYGQFDGAVLRDGAIDVRAAANTPEAASRHGLAMTDRAIEQEATVQLANQERPLEQAHQRA